MKTLPRLICILVFTAAHLGLAASGAGDATLEAEILRLDTRRIDALVKADLKTLDEIYSDALVYVHSGGKIDSKQPYLALLTSGNLNYVSQHYDPPARVVLAGADAAFVTGRVTLELKSKTGQVTKRVLTTTTVYARGTAGWKAVLYQATPVLP